MPAVGGLGDQRVHVFEGAVIRRDVAVVGHVISPVGVR